MATNPTPYVPAYQSQQEPSVIPSAPAAPLLDSSAQGLASLSGTLDQSARVLYQADTQRAVMAAHGQLAQGMIDVTDYANNLKETWGDGDPTGYTAALHKMIDDYGTKLVGQQTNPTARAYVADTFARLGMHMVEQGSNWERNQQQVYQAGQVGDQGDKWAKIVAGDPEQFQMASAMLEDSIGTAKLLPDVRARVRDVNQGKLLMAANQSLIGNNARAAYGFYGTALGIKDEAPTLPNPSPTPGSAAPAVSGPASDVWGGEANRARDTAPAVTADGTPIPGDQATATQVRTPWFTVTQTRPIPAGVQAARDQRRLGILQSEFDDASKRKDAGDPDAERDMDALATEINRMGGIQAGGTLQAGAPAPAAAAPLQVASSGETATDTGPPSTLPLDPLHTSTGTTTGVPYIDKLSTQQLVALRNEAHSRMLQGQGGARAQVERLVGNLEMASKLDGDTSAVVIPDSLIDAAYPDKPTADAMREKIQAWRDFGTDRSTYKTMPSPQINDTLKKNKPTDPGASDYGVRAQRWVASNAAAAQIMEARQKDGVDALDKQGVGMPIVPPDLGNMDALQAELEKRQQNSGAAQGVYLDRPLVFTNPEAKNIGEVLATAPFDKRIAIVATMRKALTDPATFQAAMQQIYPHAPELISAAALANFEPGYALEAATNPPATSAELVYRGHDILNPSKEQAATDGLKGSSTTLMPDERLLEQDFANRAGDLYAGHADALKTDYQAYRYAYAAVAARDGRIMGVDRSVNTTVADEAFKAAVGSTIQMGGHTITKPYGMPDALFRQRFQDAYAEELARNGMDPKTHSLNDYPPINNNDGSYSIRAGKGYLLSPLQMRGGGQYQPITIDISTDPGPTEWGPPGSGAPWWMPHPINPDAKLPTNYLEPGLGASGRKY